MTVPILSTIDPQKAAVAQLGIKGLVYSDELSEKWPPPAEKDGRLDKHEVDEVKADMYGQQMAGSDQHQNSSVSGV